MKTIVCRNCGYKNKFRGKSARKKKKLCKKCGMRLDLQDRAPGYQGPNYAKGIMGVIIILVSLLLFYFTFSWSIIRDNFFLVMLIVDFIVLLIGFILILTSKAKKTSKVQVVQTTTSSSGNISKPEPKGKEGIGLFNLILFFVALAIITYLIYLTLSFLGITE
jgi:uncharacterized protein (DUF983 family)